MSDKPFSQACENNKQPILDELERVFVNSKKILEIGSGTGQHAAFFAAKLPHLDWYTSDRPDYHQGINMWLQDCNNVNVHPPISFTIGEDQWPVDRTDGVFTANTTHIMQPSEAQKMMQMVAGNLPVGGLFCQYGPFTFQGKYTSQSNHDFDQHLLTQNCGGIRDVDELCEWAESMELKETIVMPANNFLLVWSKP